MPTSREAAVTSLPILAAAVLFAGLAPEAAFGQAGSALFAVGERGSRPPKQAAPKAPPVTAAVDGAQAAAQAPAAAPGSTVRETRPRSRTETRRRNATKQAAAITLDGRWHDSQCLPLSSAVGSAPRYVQREFEFNDARKTWQLQASVYSAASCLASARMLTYRGAGSFALSAKPRAGSNAASNAPSNAAGTTASNAHDATFRIDRWSATPETREGVLALLNDRCGSGDFEQGRTLDLSATGCPSLGIRPIVQAPQESEPVAVSNGRFFLGTRSFAPGLAFDRPAQLSSNALVRSP